VHLSSRVCSHVAPSWVTGQSQRPVGE